MSEDLRRCLFHGRAGGWSARRYARSAPGESSGPGGLREEGAALGDSDGVARPVRDAGQADAAITEENPIAGLGRFADFAACAITSCIAAGCPLSQGAPSLVKNRETPGARV